MKFNSFKKVENELSSLFLDLASIQKSIREKLVKHADGKTLKGNELVGWLGEVYCKYLFKGYLVDDSFEHDVETKDGLRISVKARKGKGKGWNKTSAISKIKGANCPTHLLFVHLNDYYFVDHIWLYPWSNLLKSGRFKKHMVRGNMRSYYFLVNQRQDNEFLIFKNK